MTASAARWVVVGAGSAGCVVARRLVESGASVTLIEAGPPLPSGAVPPTISGDDCFAALTDDRIHTDLFAARTPGQPPTVYLRGRGVGGSSAVNAMVALHGDDELYRSWGWDDVAESRERVRVPMNPPVPAELGDVDRAVLSAAHDASVVALTRRNGRRVTSAEAYLWDLVDDHVRGALLEIRSDSLVDRVVVDDAGGVTGVRLAGGAIVEGDAVVLCAGAIHSPAVLLRSRLGPEGVGEGLADHPAAALALDLVRPPGPRDGPGDGRDSLGLAVGVVVDRDPIQILGMNHLGVPGGPGLLMVALMRPHTSSGTVRLRSDDPRDHPVVDFDLLRDPRDVEVLRGGVRDALDLVRTDVFRDLVRGVYIDDIGTSIDALGDDRAIDEWLLARGADYVHASGTCAMGRVVDDDGAVPGVEGLYVCDASVFPSIPNVNTHIPTTMLAERLVARWTGTSGPSAARPRDLAG